MCRHNAIILLRAPHVIALILDNSGFILFAGAFQANEVFCDWPPEVANDTVRNMVIFFCAIKIKLFQYLNSLGTGAAPPSVLADANVILRATVDVVGVLGLDALNTHNLLAG